MKETELRELLENHVPRVAESLMEIAAPTIRIYLNPSDDSTIPIGASKMGGGADLPAGVEWPSWHEPMAFIAQFNLAQVAPYDRESALPDHGLLSFFYETDGEPLYAERWGLPEDTPYEEEYYHKPVNLSWRVLYHEDDPATFIRHEIPEEVNDLGRYSPCTARFAAELTLPEVDGPEIAPLGLSQDERLALVDLDTEINHGSWEEGGHHLLGYHYDYGNNALDAIDDAARGIPWAAERYQNPGTRLRRKEEANRRWRLLLQVSSSDDTNMGWGGGGDLYYFIEREALRSRDFSRVWVNLGYL